jgi:hypothetical protein
MPAAIKEVKEFYEEMEQEFLAFFTALQQHTLLELTRLKNEFHYNT